MSTIGNVLPGKQSGGKLLMTSRPSGNSAGLGMPGTHDPRRRLAPPLVGVHMMP